MLEINSHVHPLGRLPTRSADVETKLKKVIKTVDRKLGVEVPRSYGWQKFGGNALFAEHESRGADLVTIGYLTSGSAMALVRIVCPKTKGSPAESDPRIRAALSSAELRAVTN